jgi:hypothetical protein
MILDSILARPINQGSRAKRHTQAAYESTLSSSNEANMVRYQVCGATEAHQALVDEVFVINGKYVLVESVPASICTR